MRKLAKITGTKSIWIFEKIWGRTFKQKNNHWVYHSKPSNFYSKSFPDILVDFSKTGHQVYIWKITLFLELRLVKFMFICGKLFFLNFPNLNFMEGFRRAEHNDTICFEYRYESSAQPSFCILG